MWQFTKAWNLDCTTRPAGNSTDWKVSFPGTSVGLCLFQTAHLVFASYRHLNLSESVSKQSLELTYTKGGRDLVNIVSFRNFLKVLHCYILTLMNYPAVWKVLPLFRTSSCFAFLLILSLVTSFPQRWKVLPQKKLLYNKVSENYALDLNFLLT